MEQCLSWSILRLVYRDVTEERQDNQILEGFSLEDLDLDTLIAFRNRFSARKPDHPFVASDDKELLSKIGAWRSLRGTEKSGLKCA